MSIKDSRREYQYSTLTRESLLENPFDQFRLWMEQAIDDDIVDPTAMSVATVNSEGKPWQRMVLLKGFDELGFVFYTNTESRKANEIAQNPHVSLLFPWLSMDRQVIVAGCAELLAEPEVQEYFTSRPKQSKLAAWASMQSTTINSREQLDASFENTKQRFGSEDIPLPPFWGGFRVVPEEFEFWQGGKSRLHDRFSFKKEAKEWTIARLSP